MPDSAEHSAAQDVGAYLQAEGLDDLLAEAALADATPSLPPVAADLARLHRLVRTRHAFTVLEFGSGFSTLVIADALMKNRADFAALADAPDIAPPDGFRLHSVDTGQDWIDVTARRLPEALRDLVTFHCSPACAGTFAGQVCHFYDRLPDVNPDFIYLDGPDPRAVAGTVNGLGFAQPGRTPMAGDLLLMEPLFLPGLFILVDGRVNNARFLQRNFRRRYAIHEDLPGDFTTFALDEPPVGIRNRQYLDYCLGSGR